MRRLNLRIVRLLTVLVAIGSVLAQRADDPAFLPEALHCESIGLPGGGTTSYDAKGDSIVKRVTGSKYSKDEVEEEKSRRPSTEEWNRFWATLSQLRVQDWKNEYSPQQLSPALIIYDGHQWTFTCRRGDFDVRLSGQNAYPELANPQKTTRDNAAFSLLTEALENLVNPPAN